MLESMLNSIPPILIAAAAGYLPYRAGVLNIGLEGLMALGAFCGFLAAAAFGGWATGIAAGILAGGLAAALFALTVERLKANIFLSGLALNLAAAGGIGIASQLAFGTRGVLRPAVLGAPDAASVPDWFALLFAGALYLLLLLFLRRSRAGHRLIAAGEAPGSLEALGVDVERIRFLALTASGAGCGAAGALLSLDIGAWVPNMTGGRGWIALVALYIAAGRPLGLLGTVLLFTAAGALATTLQGLTGIPDSLLLASPFLITFLGLLAASGVRTLRRGIRE